MKIAITGASGLLGRALVRRLCTDGHEVRALVRSPEKVFELPPERVFRWSDRDPAPPEALEKVDAVIHLAGEGIADARWTKARKKRLRDSRVLGTENLVRSISRIPSEQRPRTLVSASAIGFYGDTGDDEAKEDAQAGDDFLAGLCLEWESQALQAESLGLRVVTPRLGVVLSRDGGALEKMGPAVLGHGRQWMSWIHVDDLVNFFARAVSDESVVGAYNLTSPHPVRNVDFTKSLAKAFGYPLTLPAPAFALKLALGEMSSLLLASQRVIPDRLLKSGFHFLHPDLEGALRELSQGGSFLDQRFSSVQFVPLPRKDIFPFFSKAENLEVLTPPWLNFRILDSSTPQIEKDTLIDYRLKIRGLPVRWKTHISEWNPGSSFVDDQLRGPYSKWHHVHSFEDVPGGTLLLDEITFRVPGALAGKLLLSPWVRRDINTIFSYRRRTIRELASQGKLR